MTPYKKRTVDLTRPVEIYRCLNRGGKHSKVWSIRQDGKVVGHVDSRKKRIVLRDCQFVVEQGGKNRCLRTKERNVHAYVRGYPAGDSYIRGAISFVLQYDPFRLGGFYSDLIGDVEKASVVYTQDDYLLFQL